MGARIWLGRFANDEQFRTYASLDQLRARRDDPSRPFARFVPHRLLGYVPAPDFREGADRHDALGFRGAGFPLKKPPGELRIVCLGGSTTYTSFVEDAALSYPALLERALHAAGATHVRVINAGVPGYSSFESVANLQHRVLELEPDMIIVYHAINDVLHRMIWPPAAYRGDDSGYLQHSPGFAGAVPLLERSSLARILMIDFDLARSHLSLSRTFGVVAPSAFWWAYERQVAAGIYPSGTFRGVSAEQMLRQNPPVYFRRNIESMLAIAQAHDIQPVLASFARLHYRDDDPLSSPLIFGEIDAHDRIIEEIGRVRGAPVFDFAAVFPRDPKIYVGAVHVGPMGSQIKADLFAGFLLESGLIAARATGDR